MIEAGRAYLLPVKVRWIDSSSVFSPEMFVLLFFQQMIPNKHRKYESNHDKDR